jgi:hypothetical protein
MRRRDFLRLAALTAGAAACGTTDEPGATDGALDGAPDASPPRKPRDLDAIPASTQVESLDTTNTHWTFATPANNYVVIRANPVADATHPTPWLDLAFYDATTQLFSSEYRLL